jgi:lipopolysaccharide transport system ATP-binding protein
MDAVDTIFATALMSNNIGVILTMINVDELDPEIEVPSFRSPSIEVKDATLVYPVGQFGQRSLKASIFSLFGHAESLPPVQNVEAFRQISVSISEHERVGIVGKNGSGKSSILRAMAGIYPLASGSICVTGKLGTLLDVSTGFEPEATGRQNIYHRGLALGISKALLAESESAIEAFADLGHFIDLPVRTYSTGMYVRLGFSISTHFSPEILLIDEVLGAGDAAFASRATERIEKVVDGSGLVVMASHNNEMLNRMCDRILWLHEGDLRGDGAPSEILPAYEEFMSKMSPQSMNSI